MSAPLLAVVAVVRYGTPNAPVWVGMLEGADDRRPLMLAEYGDALPEALAEYGRVDLGRWHYAVVVPDGTTLESLAEALRPAQWEATR